MKKYERLQTYRKLAKHHLNKAYESLLLVKHRMSERQKTKIDWSQDVPNVASDIRRHTFHVYYHSLAMKAVDSYKKYVEYSRSAEEIRTQMPDLILVHTEPPGIRQIRANIRAYDRRRKKVGLKSPTK